MSVGAGQKDAKGAYGGRRIENEASLKSLKFMYRSNTESAQCVREENPGLDSNSTQGPE